MLKGKRPVGQLVRRTPYARLDMIPADVAYRHMDRLLVDRRRRRHREWLAHPLEALAGLMRAAIPQAAVAEQMSEKQAPVAVFSPRSRVASAYEALWNEIREVAGVG